MKHLINLFNNIKDNLFEYYVQTLIIVGLPAIAWVYIDLRAAFTTFIIASITMGVLAIRGNK